MPPNSRLIVQKRQNRYFSDKKRRYIQKAQVIADLHTEEILATDFCNRKKHDFQLFKQGRHTIAEQICILADVGYQRLSSLHSNRQTPAKKSKLQPLNQKQKAANRTLSKKRILIGNIIRKLKILRILSERHRNRRKRFGLRFNLIAAISNLDFQSNSYSTFTRGLMNKSFSKTRRIGFGFITIGIILIGLFAFADKIGLGQGGTIGAAQLLGMEIGVLLALIGLGLATIKWDAPLSIQTRLKASSHYILNLSPTFWVTATFIALYAFFFISPMFFAKPSVHYFTKYIPDAWITRIGFDIETTVSHVETWMRTGVSPYADRVVPYPPLALASFAPFAILGYPAYFKLLTLITLAAFILSALILPRLLIPNGNRALLYLMFVTALFSYGFQFELERGQFNILAFSAALAAIYIFHFQPKFRFLAYLLFSFSVQLKLYPAIYILLLVDDWRDWKGNLKRFAWLGLFNIALLFVLGIPLAREFITQIVSRQTGLVSSRNEDMSISGYVYSLTTDFLLQVAPHAAWIEKFFLLLFASCLIYVIARAFLRNQHGLNFHLLAVSTIGALIIPAGSFDYKLPILAAPLTLVLSQMHAPEPIQKKIAFIGFTILLSAAYWSTLYPFQVKPEIMARNFPAIMVILLSVTALNALTDGIKLLTIEGNNDSAT